MHPAFALLLLVLSSSAAGAQQRARLQCARCHADREFLTGKAASPAEDDALFVSDSMLVTSRHDTLSCASCHRNYDDAFPHQPTTTTVECASCHQPQAAEFDQSIHAANVAGAGDAPDCVRCHTAHRVMAREDRTSPTYPLNEAALCAECHEDPQIIETYFTDPADSVARTAVSRYHETVHGLALAEGGLVVSATCSDCHGAHRVLPSDSAGSSIARDSIPATCGTCHVGVLEDYLRSSHGAALASGEQTEEGHDAPACNDCHSSHGIVTPEEEWQVAVVEECGECHERLYETYFATYHGKVTRLGTTLAAQCSDCHTAHANLPPDDPASSVHETNIVQTCAACHPNSTARFAQYIPHGDPHDKEGYPRLYWAQLAMELLLAGVFTFFGAHTLLWLGRSAYENSRRRRQPLAESGRARTAPSTPPAGSGPDRPAPADEPRTRVDEGDDERPAGGSPEDKEGSS